MPFWSFDARLFVKVFGLIFVAELPDKTALFTIVLAARHRPAAVFLGAAGVFAVQSLVAVAFGGALNFLPPGAVRIGSALLFLVFAGVMWLRPDEGAEAELEAMDRSRFLRAAGACFMVVFIAEWGDLTQLATVLLAAKHGRPLTVFLAATSALWAVAALAVAVGRKARRHIRPLYLRKFAAVVFAVVGLAFLLR